MHERAVFDELNSYANALLREAGSHGSVALPYRHGQRSFKSWLRTPRAVAASMTLVVFGNVGMAVASDSAIPGDMLYPVDRAYERAAELVGWQLGGPSERLDEAVIVLDLRGPASATRLVAESLEDLDETLSQDLEALAEAIEGVASSDDPSAEIRELVSALTAAARDLVDASPNADFNDARATVRSRVTVLASVVGLEDFTPPGQDEDFKIGRAHV